MADPEEHTADIPVRPLCVSSRYLTADRGAVPLSEACSCFPKEHSRDLYGDTPPAQAGVSVHASMAPRGQ